MKLGVSADGRALTYDASLYEFRLSKKPVSYDDVCALERRDWIRWRAPELREWFVKIDRDAFVSCARAARGRQVVRGASQPRLLYRSTNPAVAVVDETGRVSVRGEGSADIMAARLDDPEFSSPARLVTIVSNAVGQSGEVRESFKSKGGKLPKDKTFKLPVLPEGSRGYGKTGGSDYLTVTAKGKVTVEKGTPRGIHIAEVEQCGPAGSSELTVSVEVR